jgi:hypothetical protein
LSQSSSSTSTTTSGETSNNNTSNNNQETIELPTTLEAALQRIDELKSKRDKLLETKAKSEKELERMTKAAKIAHLKTLVPRVLYRNSDDYEREISKVAEWKNIPDEDIAAIYAEKLRSIDLGKRVAKQHSSSVYSDTNIFSHFRSIPNFYSAAAQNKTTDSDNVKKLFDLSKKIAGSSNN